MNNDNVLEVIQVAESLSCTKLAQKARQYVDRYFLDLSMKSTWVSTPIDLVTSILASSNLYVEQESVVWEAFKRWTSENIHKVILVRKILIKIYCECLKTLRTGADF